MQEQDIRVFGIRHHGAGSARRLIKALEDYGPDAICIELPAESEHLFSALADADLESPIAFLCYQVNNANRFFYLPMAEFSPEFQAIQYGLRKDIIMRAMDLPAAHALISENFKFKIMSISFGYFWYGSRIVDDNKFFVSISGAYIVGRSLDRKLDTKKRVLILNKLNIKT